MYSISEFSTVYDLLKNNELDKANVILRKLRNFFFIHLRGLRSNESFCCINNFFSTHISY